MATRVEILIHCGLCEEKHTSVVELSDGWAHRYGGLDDEVDGFCPKHAKIADFAASQCPGCVGGWGDCAMWQAFAFPYRRNINSEDYKALEAGYCPRRVNGTVRVQMGGSSKPNVMDVDLSNPANAEAGKAFAEAIREYIRKYT